LRLKGERSLLKITGGGVSHEGVVVAAQAAKARNGPSQGMIKGSEGVRGALNNRQAAEKSRERKNDCLAFPG